MVERSPGHLPDVDGSTASLIQSSPTELNQEHDEEEPRGSLVLLLLFLAVMVGVWLYVYFLLLERV